MRVVVDLERCVGSGTCELLAPEVFEVGDDGVVTLLRPEPGADQLAAVRDAVAQCPTQALSLAD
ncbi:ferredoxin [Geodermatophilus sp. SYSU D00965]|jgi:ferredoxin